MPNNDPNSITLSADQPDFGRSSNKNHPSTNNRNHQSSNTSGNNCGNGSVNNNQKNNNQNTGTSSINNNNIGKNQEVNEIIIRSTVQILNLYCFKSTYSGQSAPKPFEKNTIKSKIYFKYCRFQCRHSPHQNH